MTRAGSLDTFGGSCSNQGSGGNVQVVYTDTDNNYTTTFSITGDITITHNLGKYPAVTVIDSGGTEVDVEVIHLSLNSCRLLISPPTSGTVTLN